MKRTRLRTKHHFALAAQIVLGCSGLLGACGSEPEGPGGGPSPTGGATSTLGGGPGSGGSGSGGIAAGGLAAGGLAAGGLAAGGLATGGTSNGGAGAGGTAVGGLSTGGIATGGRPAGGTGGRQTGGTSTGGIATGGTGGKLTGGTGGIATGGTAVGGNSSGGKPTGGTSTGGTSTGGTGGTSGGASIYVSPTGNDANSGALDAPLKTLTAARDLATQRKVNNTPVTVYLRGGTYYLSAPVEFGPAHSGTATAPIFYAAYGSEKPVISGGIKVNASWATHSGSIQVATIGTNLKVDQLFLNGKRQVLARYPNYDSTKRLDGYAGDSIAASRVNRWANPAEGPGYIRTLHDGEWGGNSFIITGKSGSTVDYRWVGDNNRGSGMHTTYRMVENIFEELDAPGEWYYKKSTGQLFFYPPSGADLGTATVELASQDELIRMVGTSSARVQHLTFKGLTFTHTYRTLFSRPYETLLRGDWAIARAGAVFLTNAENIRVEACTFDQLGGNGVFISGYNRNHTVTHSKFEEAGATCVAICGLKSSVRCPANSYTDSGSCNDRTPGPLTNDYPSNVLVENNTMHNFGRFEKQTAGVNLSMTMNNTVRHNTIHKMPRAGINFTDGCWGGHLIEWNWVYDSVLETGDHGPLNAWGRDRNARWSSDVDASKLDAMHTTTIRNNRFEVRPPYFGIDLDDQATNYHQYNNLCIGGGLKVQWNRYNTYENNILVNGAAVDIHSPWSDSHHTFARNIIVGSAAYSLFQITDLNTIKTRIPTLDHNLFYNDGADPRICHWLNRGSEQFTWSQWKAAGLDPHSVVADPMFVNPAAGDYRVKDGSPALALGFKNFPMTGFGATTSP